MMPLMLLPRILYTHSFQHLGAPVSQLESILKVQNSLCHQMTSPKCQGVLASNPQGTMMNSKESTITATISVSVLEEVFAQAY